MPNEPKKPMQDQNDEQKQRQDQDPARKQDAYKEEKSSQKQW